jgi:hypothetical protein
MNGLVSENTRLMFSYVCMAMTPFAAGAIFGSGEQTPAWPEGERREGGLVYTTNTAVKMLK